MVDLELTEGERFLISRRRKNISQSDAAAELGITASTYISYEKAHARKFRHAPPVPAPEVGELALHERIVVLRTRLGWTLMRAAEEVGTSRATYAHIEAGGRTTETWGNHTISLMEKRLGNLEPAK